MNVFTRLFFVLLGFIGLYILVNNFTSLESLQRLSVSQGLMLTVAFPGSLFILSLAGSYTKKHEDQVLLIVSLLIGIFFTMLSYVMYTQTDERVYSVFAWLSLFICGNTIGQMMRFPRRK